MKNIIKAFIYALIGFILYFPLREIGVHILRFFDIGVIYYSYSCSAECIAEIMLGAFIFTFLLFYLYLKGEKIRYYSALILSVLPILTGNLPYLLLPIILLFSKKMNNKKIVAIIIGFIFFQWIITTIAISIPNQEYIGVSDDSEKVFVFTHGADDSTVMYQGKEIQLKKLVLEKGWDDKKFYIFACYGSEVCKNYEYCRHVPEVNGLYIPHLTFFYDVFYAIFTN